MNPTVTRNAIITLDYHVTDPDGEVLDEGRAPLIYLHGGYDDIFPRIEEALQGKKIGESVKVKLQPDDAFGEYDADLVQIEPRQGFPEELQIGMQFESQGEGEDEDDDDFILYRVTEITDDKVVLDGNHPLAGMALVFTCTVTAIRPASEEELRRGHAQGPDDDDEEFSDPPTPS